MKRVTFLCVCLWSCTAVVLHAQPAESLQPSRHLFQLTHILTKDGTARSGWFLGTFRDSLVAQVGGRTERISRRDLLRVDIEGKSQTVNPALVGVFMGAYAGNALMLKAENHPFLFVRHADATGLALYSALFGLVGGGIGYLVGAAQGQDLTFDFSGSEERSVSSWEQLTEGSSASIRKPPFHFSVQGAWVNGPLPNSTDRLSFYGEAATALNMMRKVQLTYSLTDFADAGFACVWLGQPSLSYWGPHYSSGSTLSLNGRGYFAVAVFQPLGSPGWQKFQWDIGAGAGIASMDVRAVSGPDYYSYFEPGPRLPAIQKTTTTFSAMMYTELKVLLTDHFSLGITADWVYVPTEVPDVPDVAFASKTLGTTSIGFVLGLHL